MKLNCITTNFPSFSVSHEENVHHPELLISKKKKNVKAELFNKKASDPKNEPDEVLNALGLQQGLVVADIGSGGGYFALRLAEVVGTEGRVFAVDTNQDFLAFIEKDVKERGLTNVETVLATRNNPILPDKGVDLVFMRNVSHHITNRVEYFKRLRNVLKSEGRVAIIEYRGGGGLSFHRLFGHSVPKETIIKEMEEANYKVKKDLDFLPEQSFTIFSPCT